MKTILDEHNELYLDSLIEEDKLICKLLTMKVGNGNRKIPDYEGARFEVNFLNASDYLVLQEFTHVALGLDYLDDGHLTQCKSSKISDIIKIQDIFLDEVNHYVLRTAHCVIHVFTSDEPTVFESK